MGELNFLLRKGPAPKLTRPTSQQLDADQLPQNSDDIVTSTTAPNINEEEKDALNKVCVLVPKQSLNEA